VSEADFAFIQQLMLESAGFILEEDKQYLVETRLEPVLAHCGLTSVADLVLALRSKAKNGLHRATVEAMVNGETSFFRDVACFEILRKEVIPQIIARRRTERRLDIWSACCSTGQEPYSLAMMLTESFPELAGWDVRILATDLSKAHLQRAREGRYAQFEVNRGLPASLLVKYFEQEDRSWVLSPVIRRQVEFGEMNLVQPWPSMPSMDVVLIRNVMIYWDLKTKREVLSRVHDNLRPGGCLVLGGSETTYYIDLRFDRLSAESVCCFRVKD
jgi:chemotaxis protein methyltransferase CheR